MSITTIKSEPGQGQLNIESTLQGLSLYDACIQIEHTPEQILSLFEVNPLLPGLIIMDKTQLVGMISRRRFFEYMSRRYSLELITKRHLQGLYQFSHTELLVFPGYTSITAAVRETLRRSPALIYEPVIVQTTPGVYKLLDVHQLLMAHSEVHEIAMAAHKQMGMALQEAKEQLQAVLDAVPGFVSWISSDLRYLGVNRNLAESFNLSPETFASQEIGFLNVSPNFTQFMGEFFANTTETVSQQMTTEVDGESRSYLMVAQKYNQGKAAVTVGVDISKIKRLEEELRKSLEHEKELSELKSRFVSMTSHEFRTPLSTILSSADLLQRYSHKWPEEKKLFHINRIQTTVKHMVRLLDDVLTIGKAEAGRLELNFVPLNVEKFCQEMVEELRASDRGQHTISFTDKCGSTCFGLDEKVLRHILSNLLSNAVKYSPPGSEVKFEVACLDEALVFKVEDQGIGIPTEDQRRLFEPFHRAANVGNLPGTGLGLAIVKKCVDLHGGDLKVDSQVGIGTTFTVTLAATCLHAGVSTHTEDWVVGGNGGHKQFSDRLRIA
ncbi:ATP-binding protein [Microcoleus sp. FACHB-831]|uniref:sensor histidine kinase n=1 Tax=Microcoleus sp. FACHB-831 TaxID=2692827 RepID=UPI001F55390F|nr:ATP-binding protein [Microcoleus sp. FACHB-831]